MRDVVAASLERRDAQEASTIGLKASRAAFPAPTDTTGLARVPVLA
jgi:hypothetical protein